MDSLLALLFLLGALGLIALTMRQMRHLQVRRAWRKLASRLELILTEGQRMSGRYLGFTFEVVLSGASSQVRMRIQAELPPGLSVSRQRPGARRLRGVRDIQVGDKPLDDAALIQASASEVTVRLLRAPAVREAILELLAEHPQAVVLGNEVVVPLEQKPNEELCRRAIRAAHRVAAALETSADTIQEQIREARTLAQRQLAPPLFQAFKPYDITQPEPPGLSPEAVRKSFAVRLRLYKVLLSPIFLGAILYCIAVAISWLPDALNRQLAPWFLWTKLGAPLLAAGFFIGWIGRYLLLRCPACGERLSLYHQEEGQFHYVATEACPNCQSRLS